MGKSSKRTPTLVPEEVVQDIVKRLSAMPNVGVRATAESRIAEDLNMDSLAIMDFMMALEDGYDVALPLDRLAKIRTVGELAQLVVRLHHDKPAS
jgi:acyl carrier protein